jgi:hypothetical protein
MLIMWSSHVFFWMQTVARDLVIDNVWLVIEGVLIVNL